MVVILREWPYCYAPVTMCMSSLTLPGLAPTPGRISGPSERSSWDPPAGGPVRRPRNVKESYVIHESKDSWYVP
eukprot:1177559-Prorocentrum_minimum.AAC.3